MITDPIANMLSSIRNAQMAQIAVTETPYSKIKTGILEVLTEEGYISGYEVNGEEIKTIAITLKYQGKDPVIKVLKRISKPGLRVYKSINDLPKYYNGLGIAILSTSKGIVADHKARSLNVGGEVICNVF